MINEKLNNKSISIVLKQFKEEHISESEAVQLIEDLYSYRTSYIPYWPQITYTSDDTIIPKYEITCKHD